MNLQREVFLESTKKIFFVRLLLGETDHFCFGFNFFEISFESSKNFQVKKSVKTVKKEERRQKTENPLK